MSLLTRLPERITDRLNPIVVKELRQAVQSRFVTAALIAFLAIQVVVIGIFLLFDESIATDFSSGSEIFVVLQGILVAACILFVPTYTAIRLAAERANVDLMFVTTIKPWSIISGKLLAAMVLTLLLFSACMPFMTFTYMLRGIDLPSMFVTLAIAFLVVLVATQTSILIASIPASLVARILLGLLMVFGLVVTAIWGATGLGFAAGGGIGSTMWTWEFWGIAALVLLSAAEWVGLNMFLSAALLSPPSSNRMLPVRVFITAAWLVTGVAAGIWSWVITENIPLLIWAGSHVQILCFALLIAVCERQQWSPRVARKIPRNPLMRLPAFLLFTGWAGGVAWCIILLVLSLAGSLAWAEWSGYSGTGDVLDGLKVMAGFALYAYAYAMTAMLIRKAFFRNRIKGSRTWVIALVMLTIACTVPIVTAFLISPSGMHRIDNEGIWLVGVPFMLFDHDYQDKCLIFAGIWSVLVFFLSLPWFINRFVSFKPLQATSSPSPRSTQYQRPTDGC